MRNLLLSFLILFVPQFCRAVEQTDSVVVPHENTTVKEVFRDTTINRREKIHQYGGIIKRVIKAFDDIDTNYIERPKYHWQFHMKSTYSGEWLSLANHNTNQRVRFDSHRGIKFGPNIGWHWLGLGYDFDAGSLGNGHKYRKTEFNFSVYSTMFGFDAFYRRTGQDYTLSKMNGFNNLNQNEFLGNGDNGIQVAVTGLNAYYVVNRHKFSLGSAYANSMKEQIRSVGTWKFGFSVTKHDINFSKDTLMHQLDMVYNRSGQYVRSMRYWDASLSAGYSYNWVFAKHWLLNIDLQPALGYKRTNSEIWKVYDTTDEMSGSDMRNQFYRMFLERGNINYNLTTRAALVWNNGHYFGGLTLVAYNFNYRHQNMVTHHTFFTLKGYLGLCFMEKKSYKEKKKRLAQHKLKQNR